MSTADNKSYLPVSLGGFSPWGSRSSTPKPSNTPGNAGSDGAPGTTKGGDHTIGHRNRISLSRYPKDCPPLNVRWFYASDVPKRKQMTANDSTLDDKPPPVPKKFVPFSSGDSNAVELAFQKTADEEQDFEKLGLPHNREEIRDEISHSRARPEALRSSDKPLQQRKKKTTVPVQEDYLFDVNIEQRELYPAYWLGPVYEVRRGSWFLQDGASLKPCEENLANQLEEGYLKMMPFRSIENSEKAIERQKETEQPFGSPRLNAKGSKDSLNEASGSQSQPASTKTGALPLLQSYRLFGTYMNTLVTYQDENTAWMVTDDLMSRMSSSVYQRFGGGAHLGGTKIIRGYSEPGKSKEGKTNEGKRPGSPSEADRPSEKERKRRSAPVPGPAKSHEILSQSSNVEVSDLEKTTDATQVDEDEIIRKLNEQEIEEDYRNDSENQDREIDHLLLVTHGIGQRLGLRMESVNFVHDVNTLRKTLKAVYGASTDLQALNDELESLPKNCRIQVLPVCWRHLLDFPKQGLKKNRKEHDLGDADSFGEDDEYPSLKDITIEGVPQVRNLITDLALDILLYQSAYREHISTIVLKECNRIHQLFIQRNPTFKGKVSLVGHSLGSAIFFDILCRQKSEERDRPITSTKKYYHNRPGVTHRTAEGQSLTLKFSVQDFYCLGSPIGLFQMLKARTIAARGSHDSLPAESPFELDLVTDPFSAKSSTLEKEEGQTESSDPYLPFTVSSPKCSQLFNIFHPSDPIAYRLEPLISPAMSSLKPQPLPYTKKGIFGVPGAGLTGIGNRVSQSVTGLWSTFSSGIASSILTRSLGINSEDIKSVAGPSKDTMVSGEPESTKRVSDGTDIVNNTVISSSAPQVNTELDVVSNEKKRRLARDTQAAEEKGQHPPTLIDSDIETLFAGFQKRRKSHQSDSSRDLGDSAEWLEAEERGRRLRREEAKVRALNGNGRVDFSIQEGVFDISLLASIASHLSYWSDEDVNHFIISQLLSRNRRARRDTGYSDSEDRL